MRELAWRMLGGRSNLLPAVSGGWRRITEPLMSPTVAWEGTALQEPDFHHDGSGYYGWYSGGWTNIGIGYVTNTADPTNPADWVKYAGNPVIGQGGSGITGFAGRGNIVESGGIYYAFYSDAIGTGANLKLTQSTDRVTWTTPSTAIPGNAVAACDGWANSTAWFDGTNWNLLVEGVTGHVGPSVSQWGCFLFQSATLTGSWVVQNGGNPLITMEYPGFTTGYGQGPNIAEINGILTPSINGNLTVWDHASIVDGGVTVSNINHVYGSGNPATTWVPSPVFDIEANRGTYEKEQAADPCVLEVTGQSYLFYDGVDNVNQLGYINLAGYPGTLSQLLASLG